MKAFCVRNGSAMLACLVIVSSIALLFARDFVYSGVFAIQFITIFAVLYVYFKLRIQSEKTLNEACAKMLKSGLCWGLVLAHVTGALTFYDSQKDESIWIVNGRMRKQRQVPFAIPFIQSIGRVSFFHDLQFEVMGETSDGFFVFGDLHAKMKLLSKESTILEFVKCCIRPNEKMREELKQVLQTGFQKTIEHRKLQHLIALEWPMEKEETEGFSTPSGMEWAGTVEVSNIHAYFGNVTTAKPRVD